MAFPAGLRDFGSWMTREPREIPTVTHAKARTQGDLTAKRGDIGHTLTGRKQKLF
jgi:hypothetical protein